MLTDINGNPYTTVEQDLALTELRKALSKAISTELTSAMSRKGRLEVQCAALLNYFDLAYAIGRSSEGKTAPPTETEHQRFAEIKTKFVNELAGRIRDALSKPVAGKLRIELSGVNQLLDQAYYAGREEA